jgi:hypothetical protein
MLHALWMLHARLINFPQEVRHALCFLYFLDYSLDPVRLAQKPIFTAACERPRLPHLFEPNLFAPWLTSLEEVSRREKARMLRHLRLFVFPLPF